MTDRDILLVSQNPLDLEPHELDDLAEAIRAAVPDVPVRIVGRKQGGYGVTYWEVVSAWLPGEISHDAAVVMVGIVVKEAIAWARRRFKKSPERPKQVRIYGPDGDLIKTVRVKSARGKVIVEDHPKTAEGGWKPHRPGPDELEDD